MRLRRLRPGKRVRKRRLKPRDPAADTDPVTDLALILAEIDGHSSAYRAGSTVGAILREGVIAVAITTLLRRFAWHGR
jgi:hypothetical protein